MSEELLWFTLHPLMNIYLSLGLGMIKQGTEDVTCDYFFFTQGGQDNLLTNVCLFGFFNLTFRIKVLNTYSTLGLSRGNGNTLGQVFHLNCHHTFLYEGKGFVKGITGVLNLSQNKHDHYCSDCGTR